MGKRRLAREVALQALYFLDVCSTFSAEQAFEAVCYTAEDLDEKSAAFTRELVEGAARHRKELDAHIQSTAANWELGRMTAVDRSLLRLAAYELIHHPDTPVGVVIDEALEIAKKYSSEDSPRFINGILDKIKSKRAAKTAG